MGPGVFFDLAKGETVDSVIYRNQILLELLQQFWEESFEGISCPIIMEDNAPVHKKVCIVVRDALGMVTLDSPPNTPDLNPIENIWSFMKDIIARDYADVFSVEEMKKIVRRLWKEFTNNQWDILIDSMKERMEAVIAAKGGSTRFWTKSISTNYITDSEHIKSSEESFVGIIRTFMVRGAWDCWSCPETFYGAL